MVCKCGYQNHKDAKYCADCGQRLKHVAWSTILLIAAIVFISVILVAVLLRDTTAAPPGPPEPKEIQQVHEHSWQGATCEEKKKCTICGETQGVPLGHQWKDATNTAPKSCVICGKTTGVPFEESYLDGGQRHDGEEFLMDSYEFMILYTEDLRHAGYDCDFELIESNGTNLVYEIFDSTEILFTAYSKDNAQNGNMIILELSFSKIGLTEQETSNRIHMMLRALETGDVNINASKIEQNLSVDDIKNNKVAFPIGHIEGLGYILSYQEDGITLIVKPYVG